MNATVILPALDEAGAVAAVVRGFLGQGLDVLVVDNGSRDDTAVRARSAGARVIHEPRRGYGAACLAGIEALRRDPPSVVVFADCDGTIDPTDVPRLMVPLEDGSADLVLGAREEIEAGAMPLANRAARRACACMFLVLYGRRIPDVPPLRAMRWDALDAWRLKERTYGFPVETVARAIRSGARVHHVPVRYLRRVAGKSKVGTDLPDALRVGAVMAWTTLRLRFARGAP